MNYVTVLAELHHTLRFSYTNYTTTPMPKSHSTTYKHCFNMMVVNRIPVGVGEGEQVLEVQYEEEHRGSKVPEWVSRGCQATNGGCEPEVCKTLCTIITSHPSSAVHQSTNISTQQQPTTSNLQAKQTYSRLQPTANLQPCNKHKLTTSYSQQSTSRLLFLEDTELTNLN